MAVLAVLSPLLDAPPTLEEVAALEEEEGGGGGGGCCGASFRGGIRSLILSKPFASAKLLIL